MAGENKTTGKEQVAMGNVSFAVAIGDVKLSFSKVSNIASNLEFESISEGGANDRVHTFTNGKKQPETITFERGVTNRKTMDAAKLGLKPGGRIKQPVTIMVLAYPGGKKAKMLRAYCFDEGVVVKWETGDLDALNGEVLIERFEVAHSGLMEIKAD